MLLTTIYCYLTYSTFYIFGMSSLMIKAIGRGVIVTFCIYMLYHAIKLCRKNVKKLYAKYLTLDPEVLRELRKGFMKKMILYSIFVGTVVCYYLAQIVLQVYCLVVRLSNREEYRLDGVEALMCWILYFAIVCLFHPCFFTPYFRMAQVNSRNVSPSNNLSATKPTRAPTCPSWTRRYTQTTRSARRRKRKAKCWCSCLRNSLLSVALAVNVVEFFERVLLATKIKPPSE